MKILIHGINFSPELTGIGKYSGEMADWLLARGHEVRVVTAPPYYPQWRVADGFANWWRKDQGQGARGKGQVDTKSLEPCALNLESVVVYRCPLWVPAKPSGLKRLLHLASFALSSFPAMLSQIFWRPDVVMVIEPPLMCAPTVLLVAKLSGARAWLHVQDFEVDAAFDLGILKSRWLRILVLTIERWLMSRFDRVSTISPKMLEKLLDKGVASSKALLFPNWVEINQFQDARYKVQGKATSYREELGISADAVVALYSGNMGGKQGLEILAQVAKLQAQGARYEVQGARYTPARGGPCGSRSLRYDRYAQDQGTSTPPPLDPEIIFVFCGDGAGRADLVARCEGLPNVRFMDLQPQERLSELLAFADIHLLPQRADAADLVMPSKLTGMLASGRPVVATAHANTELANVVTGCGLVVEPEQPQAFADAINMLARDATLRERLGKAGRVYAEKYLDRDVVLAKFEQDLLACVKQ